MGFGSNLPQQQNDQEATEGCHGERCFCEICVECWIACGCRCLVAGEGGLTNAVFTKIQNLNSSRLASSGWHAASTFKYVYSYVNRLAT